jgi:hypothetical protein
LRDLSTSAVHRVARFYAAPEATIHGHRAKIDGLRTLIKVNDKPPQVLGRRRNGAWQVDRNPPFDENAEVVIFVDLGWAPPGSTSPRPARQVTPSAPASPNSRPGTAGNVPETLTATTARSN